MPAIPSSVKHKCGAMYQGHGQDHLLSVFPPILVSLPNSEIFKQQKT